MRLIKAGKVNYRRKRGRRGGKKEKRTKEMKRRKINKKYWKIGKDEEKNKRIEMK